MWNMKIIGINEVLLIVDSWKDGKQTLRVPANENEANLINLSPFTLYHVQLISVNSVGESKPTQVSL